MVGNGNLHMSRNDKADEFYTQLSLIENELKHYKDYFKDKIVLCNCDDPFESNFFKYFAINFNTLGLKKLIATCYATSPIVYTQLTLLGTEVIVGQEKNTKNPYKVEITEVSDENNDGRIDLSDVEYLLKNRKNALILLQSDGDFRSEECVELLKQADVVITNPPFSLFREYMALLEEYQKAFIIKREREREPHGRAAILPHTHQTQTAHSYDDVIRPVLNGKKLYRRITIRMRQQCQG